MRESGCCGGCFYLLLLEKSKQRMLVYRARPGSTRQRAPPESPGRVPFLPHAPRTACGVGPWTCQFVSLAYAILKDMGKNLAFLA